MVSIFNKVDRVGVGETWDSMEREYVMDRL